MWCWLFLPMWLMKTGAERHELQRQGIEVGKGMKAGTGVIEGTVP